MRKVFLSGALALIGLAAPAALALAPAAASRGCGVGSIARGGTAAPATPGLYHVPIIGKVTLPGVVGSVLGGTERQRPAPRHRGVVVQLGRLRRHERHLQLRSSSWTEPTVNCAEQQQLPRQPPRCQHASSVVPGAASAFWVGLDGYNSTSVEQLGTDSDCDSGTPSYYAWYEMYPNPSVTLPSQYPVQPGDQMSASVAANSAGTSFTLEMEDATAGWTFSTTQTGSGFARSSAEVIAEAPSSCSLLFCSEVPLADFGQINFSGSGVIDSAGTDGSLSTFDANEITMADNGTTLATPSSLSSDGSSFSVKWDNS